MGYLINDGRPFIGSRAEYLGISPGALRRLLAGRRIRRALRGVYIDNRVPDSRRTRALALHLVKPERAVFFGTTVAYLLQVDAYQPKDRFDLVPQCIVPHGTVRCTSPLVKCREGYIRPADIDVVDGLGVTTPVRTTVDLLRTLRRPYALSAADAMAHAGPVTRAEVEDYIASMRRYPGIVQARSLAPLIDPKSESAGESWQRLRLVDAGFPAPESQWPVENHHGVVVAWLDLAYPELLVGMEFDGVQFHSAQEDREHDRGRRGYLAEVMQWRLAVEGKDGILGKDPAFEIKVGQWIGMAPQLPRLW